MGRSKQRKWLQKAIAVTMAVMVGVTFMPMFGGAVWGAEKVTKVKGDEIILDVDDPAIQEYEELQNAIELSKPEFGLDALGVPSTDPDPDNAAKLEADQGKNASHESAEANYGSTGPVNAKPYNRQSQYNVYSRYLTYNVGTNMPRYYDTWGIMKYDLYMQYRIRGGKWKTVGPMTGYTAQTYKVSGLKPNRVYQVRTFYGKTEDGYVRTGLQSGYVSSIVTLKTGKKNKPRIKSIKCKAVKVKRSWVWYYWGFIPIAKVKRYTFKVKVTVKMKKRTGAKYICIGGKYAKGNKKKYKKTFGWYTTTRKPTKCKFTVHIWSQQSKIYGGYSPVYQKTKKIK